MNKEKLEKLYDLLEGLIRWNCENDKVDCHTCQSYFYARCPLNILDTIREEEI